MENIIIYLLVEAAGEGAIPNESNTGLKMDPPPSPKAPDTHPPMKPYNSNFIRIIPVALISLSQRPLLYFVLSFNSLFIINTARIVTQILNMMYPRMANISLYAHFTIPIGETKDELPLSIVTSTKRSKVTMFRPYFMYYKWVPSFLIIKSKLFSSFNS